MMIYNHPAPLGSDIRGNFAGSEILLPAGTLKSFPFAVGKALLERYPWLSEVTDHPTATAQGIAPPPSGVVEPEEAASESGIKEPSKEFLCSSCERICKSAAGLAVHAKSHAKESDESVAA